MAWFDRGSEDVTEDLRCACPQCDAKEWASCTCEEKPLCWICLESGPGDVLRACACRGSAGYVHAQCMIEFNRHRTEKQDECPTCQQRFVGTLALEVAAAHARDSHYVQGSDLKAKNILARALLEQGDHAGALKLYRQVLIAHVAAFGHTHPLVAGTMSNIGIVLQHQGEYGKALEMYKKALKIDIKAHGPEHLDVANTYNNIGEVHRHQSKYSEAMDMYEKSLKIKIKMLGRDHPHVADTKVL